jgi:ketosteroid isomerase-like protein
LGDVRLGSSSSERMQGCGKDDYVHEQDNLKTIHQVYAAFGEGDIEGVLGMLTDDVRWSTPGPPCHPLRRA